MSKRYGVEYPERPLMAVLSDLLAIPHFTTSNGGTVRSDFLATVLEALGGEPTGLDKNGLIRACIQAATGGFDEALLSPGGTVTNDALQVIINGVTAGRGPAQEGDPVVDVVWDSAVLYDPAETADTRRREVSERAVRDGQNKFRTAVLNAYGYRCALTGADAVGALEAAHITPYRGAESNVVENGIALRADVHRLWDSGQIAIHEETGMVLLGAALRTTTYADLHLARPAKLPTAVANRPSKLALAAHRAWCRLG